MKMSGEDARDVIYEDHMDWEIVPDTKWKDDDIYKRMQGMSAVFKHIPTGKFYELGWTHYHDDMGPMAFEYEEPEFTEVESKEVTETITKTVWNKVT